MTIEELPRIQTYWNLLADGGEITRRTTSVLHRYLINKPGQSSRRVAPALCAAVPLLWGSLATGQPAPAQPAPAQPAPVQPAAAKPAAQPSPVQPARAAGPCAMAHEKAKERQQTADLREARELLLTCAKTACGEFLAQQCRSGLQQLDADIPTVVPVVTDDTGAALVDVQVTMDGEPLTSRLDGRGLPVDPGLHEFSYSTARGVFHTEKLMIIAGQRNRVLAVKWTPPVSTPPTAQPTVAAAVSSEPAVSAPPVEQDTPEVASSGSGQGKASTSVLPYVFGGVGVAAVGTSLLLVHWGSDDNEQLDQCKPNCQQASVDHVQRLYLAADITLGVGIAALGAATWLFVADLTAEKPPSHAAYRFDVTPLASGAFATVKGAF